MNWRRKVVVMATFGVLFLPVAVGAWGLGIVAALVLGASNQLATALGALGLPAYLALGWLCVRVLAAIGLIVDGHEADPSEGGSE